MLGNKQNAESARASDSESVADTEDELHFSVTSEAGSGEPEPEPEPEDDTLPFHLELAPHVESAAQAVAGRLVGVCLDDYEIVRFVARGGMGEVYEARELVLGRKVAIKVLRAYGSTLSRKPEYARLLEEARAGAHLGHPGFVHVYKFGDWEHQGALWPYLVMEWLPGRTWRAVFAQQRPPRSLAVWLPRLRTVLDAMARAHEQGILHRDLKPENILLTNSGDTKIVDLGLACLSSAPVSTPLHKVGIPRAEAGVVGTRAYMAPEVWRGEVAGPQADVWSLGTILYEALTGQHPYWHPALAVEQNARLLLNDDALVALTPLLADSEPRLGPVLRRSLCKRQAERHPSAVELLADFDAAVDSVYAANQPPRPQRGREDIVRGTALGSDPVRVLRAGVSYLLVLLTLNFDSDGLPSLRRPPAVPSGMVYHRGGRFREGLNPSEVDEVAAHCQAAHADCDRRHAERALSERVVTVSPFLMYRTEVTNQDFAEWLNLMQGWLSVEPRDDSVLVIHDGVVLIDLMPRYSGIEERAGRYVARRGRERKPVGKVTWDGALGYCKSRGSRLPSEAEWELAAGGVERRRFPWGNAEPRCAEVRLGRNPRQPCHGQLREVAEVGTSPQDVTPEGVHDLGGNVSEWVMDSFVAPYPLCGARCRNPQERDDSASSEFARHVVRGASCFNFPVWARSAMRSSWTRRSMPQDDIGFRCARTVAE